MHSQKDQAQGGKYIGVLLLAVADQFVKAPR